MQLQHKQLTPQSQRFLSSTCEDSPQIKLHKYRHFLSTRKSSAKELSQELLSYALYNNLIGEYDLIYDMLGLSSQKPQLYKQQRQQLITVTNPLRQQLQHAQSISAFDQSANLNYKLALYYRQWGMHKQSAYYFNKLFRLQSLSSKTIYHRSQYFSLWAEQLYFDNNYHQLGIFVRNEIEDDKRADVNLLLIKDLKYIQMDKADNQFFTNLLNMSSPGDITNNTIISLDDLGFLYSLVLLAKKQRSLIKKKVPWSSNIQVLYLQNRTIELLTTLHQFYANQGMFHPLIDKLYPNFIRIIKERILTEYLAVYTTLPLKDIQQRTTFKQGQLLQFLHQHSELPYLIDPVTQSLVHYEKTIPLYEQTTDYGLRVRDKWRDMIKTCINARKHQQNQNPQTNFTNIQQQGFRGIFADRHRGDYDW